jgi:hypothetical protein
MCTRLYVYSIDLYPRLYVYTSLCVPVSMCTHVFFLVSDLPFFYLIERVIPFGINCLSKNVSFINCGTIFYVLALVFQTCDNFTEAFLTHIVTAESASRLCFLLSLFLLVYTSLK